MVGAKQTTVETVDTRPLGMILRVDLASHVTPFPYDPNNKTPGTEFPEAREAVYSPNGDHFVSIEGETAAAVIRNAVDASMVVSCGGSADADTPLKINQVIFSPLGAYLLTWARPVTGISIPNLVVYRVADGKRMAAFHQKVFHIGFWPSIQWSDDESIAARSVTNNIHFFRGDELNGAPYAKLNIPGVTQYALSHGSAPYSVAAFIAGTKGAPGRIGVFQHPDDGGQQLSSRSTYRAESVEFEWNSKGSAVLAKVSTAVDSSGKSYYGESELYFFDSKGSIDERVMLPVEGPTHDAAWSPTGLEFIIIYGFMPACATLFDENCQAVFDFGTGPRNTISFSPHGRFVALAGFGNLSGNVEIWDKNKTTLVGQATMSCTTMHSWSPCSRYFLGATTFPRLRVDNGVRVIRLDGKVIHEQKFENARLHHAVFRPALRGTYSDPKFTMNDMIGGPMESPSANSASAAQKKGGIYRPPGSRGASSTLTLHHHQEAKKVDKHTFFAKSAATAAQSSQPSAGKKSVPGMDPDLVNVGPSKSALARKKKKERAAKAQSEGSSLPGPGPEEEAKEPAPEDLNSVEVGEKRAKKLKKKLRAIEALKTSKMEGKELNQEQVEKIASAATLEDELARVERRVSQLQAC